MNKFQLLLIAAGMLISHGALASGGVNLGSGPSSAPRVVDETYEFGKSVFKGRVAGAEKIKYCVMVDGEVKKLKRSTAKAYREGSFRDFAVALIDCNAPDRQALTTMDREHVPLVLYYLNKRFKLNLSDQAAG